MAVIRLETDNTKDEATDIILKAARSRNELGDVDAVAILMRDRNGKFFFSYMSDQLDTLSGLVFRFLSCLHDDE